MKSIVSAVTVTRLEVVKNLFGGPEVEVQADGSDMEIVFRAGIVESPLIGQKVSVVIQEC